MDEQHTHDLLAAYVLSAVTPDEAALVQQHLAGCASCQRLERELRAVASVLPELAGDLTPPPALKVRVMAAVAAEPRPAAGGSSPVADRSLAALEAAPGKGHRMPRRRDGVGPEPAPRQARPQRRGRRVYSLLAAVLALLVVGIVVWRLSVPGQPRLTRQYAMTGTSALPSIRGSLTYFKQGNRLQLDLRGLKQIPSNRVYELWLIRGTRVVRGVGEFRPGPNGTGHLTRHGYAVPDYSRAGLTIERAPRSKMPTRPIVATASLS